MNPLSDFQGDYISLLSTNHNKINPMKKLVLIVALLFTGLQVAHSQSYTPDRPGFGNGSYITPESVFGVEAGLSYQTAEFYDQISIGQLLLRYGVAENLELRAGLGSYTSLEINGAGFSRTASGFQDMSIGAKYNFLSGEGQPSISGLASISLPVGDDAFSSDEVVPSLSVLADYAIDETFSVSSNLGYSFGVGNLNDVWFFTLTPGVTINENAGVYAGYAGFYYGNGFNDNWIEAGLTYGLESGAQLDVNLGYESEAEAFFIGAGFAMGF